jgi:hypothetical protein
VPVSVSVVVVIVAIPMAVIFMFMKAAIVANFVFLIPVMVVVDVAARAVPIARIEATAFMARSNPARSSIGRASPITFMPAIVAADRVPVAANPHEIGCGLRGHDDHGARGWWRADLNADRNLGLCGRACQQKRRKCRSLQQMFHKLVRLLEPCRGLGVHPKVGCFWAVAAEQLVQSCRDN